MLWETFNAWAQGVLQLRKANKANALFPRLWDKTDLPLSTLYRKKSGLAGVKLVAFCLTDQLAQALQQLPQGNEEHGDCLQAVEAPIWAAA